VSFCSDPDSYLEGEISAGESILDYYHASEHLFEAMEFIYGASSAKALEQHKKYKRILHPFGFDPFGFMTL
jgi:hypothetical protein